jgi:hypothetical protein
MVMTNNVSKKKDIITSFILSDVFENEQYPVELMDVTITITRNNSKLEKLNAFVIEGISNEVLRIIRNNSIKQPIDFGTISFEIWTGLLEGDHEFSIRILLVGKKISFAVNSIYKEIEQHVITDIGGSTGIKSKKVDKTTLQIELIPLNVDLTSYIKAREKTLKEKNFYTDDVLKALLKDMTILSAEDIKDPLYKFEL